MFPRTNSVKCLAYIAAMLLWSFGLASAQTFSTKAKQVYLVDAQTGSVLFAKNEDELIPPASLAKIMTMEVVFDAIKKGQLSLDDEFFVSENAWRTGGAPSGTSTMFAEIKSNIRVEDLIRGAVIQSGNDSCIVLAEGMSGDEVIFARRMTKRAKEIGLEKSVFANSTGLPHPDSKVTMKEMVMLAQHMHSTYPEMYKIFAEPDFTWNKIRQTNRLPLLRTNLGVDGLKTGFTEESGFGIVSSLEKNGRRLFLAMSGLDNQKQREEETRRILEWGLRSFESKRLFVEGETVGTAGVYGGPMSGVDLVTKDEVNILLPIGNPDRLRARIAYDWPLQAPLEEGDYVGDIRVWVGDTLSLTAPVYAASAVERGPIHVQAWDAFKELLLFWK